MARVIARLGVAVAVGAVFLVTGGPSSTASDQSPVTPLAEPAVVSAQSVANDELLTDDGIIGTGIGLDPAGRSTLVVLVEGFADTGKVPTVVRGVPTRTLIVGEVTALPCPGGPLSDCSDPIPGGVSVGHPAITAGTLGAYVQSGSGEYYALSNNHVFADENMATIGDTILQPGPADGGTLSDPSHLFGTLAAFDTIDFCPSVLGCGFGQLNDMDAAIVSVDEATVQAANICGWTPAAASLPESSVVPGSTVLKKCGRTTGPTTGTVLAVNVTVQVQMSSGRLALFSGQIMTEDMSAGGDSGSLMLDTQNRPTALLFAGSDTATIGTPIDDVLDRFSVTIVDTDPTDPPPPNLAPTASFTVTCDALVCTFDAAASTDPDGTVVDHAWDFGDSTTGSGITPQHTYASAGARTVTLTVTDDDGATDATQRTANPTDPPILAPASTTFGLVDPVLANWHLRSAADDIAGAGSISFLYGNPQDAPFMGDWDCDGIDTPGLFRRSDAFAYLRNANTQGVADISFFFGNPSDVPLAGDFDGDGCDTLSIYRPSEARVYVINSLGTDGGGLGAADYSFLFGDPGDEPVVGDWDGDGIDEIGLYRASTGFLYWRNSLDTGIADGAIYFGDPGDRFVAGDWGVVDGKDTPGVYRPSTRTFYFRHTLTQGVADDEVVWVGAGADWLPLAGIIDSPSG